MYNTPPVFAIYVLMLVTRWLETRSEASRSSSSATARRLRSSTTRSTAATASTGDTRQPGSRSLMNVTWRLPSEDLERRFIEEAAARGLVELKGHRSVGGIRASLYNAMPLAGAQALARLHADVRRRTNVTLPRSPPPPGRLARSESSRTSEHADGTSP